MAKIGVPLSQRLQNLTYEVSLQEDRITYLEREVDELYGALGLTKATLETIEATLLKVIESGTGTKMQRDARVATLGAVSVASGKLRRVQEARHLRSVQVQDQAG